MRPGNSLTWILRAVGVLAALAPMSLLGAGCGGAEDRPAQWTYIYPAIIEPSCATASCHSNYTREAGVNFGYESEAYYQLIMRHFVTPSDSADSEVLYLMKAQGARRMPPDFALPEADIDLIAKWIDAGATQQ